MESTSISSLWREANEPRLQPWFAVLIALVASAPRIWFVLLEHPPGLYVAADMAHYELCAEHIRQGTATAADTFTPFGYPALLALLFALSQKSYVLVAWVHVLLGSATAGLVHLVAYRVSRSFPFSLGASLATSVYFPIIFYAGFLLSETTFCFLIVLSIWLSLRALDRSSRSWRVALGVAMGAATMVRPNFAMAIPIVLGWGAFFDRDRARARFVPWALAGALPILLMACAYNSWLVGRPTGVATNGGVNFFLAHSDYTSVRFPPEDAIGGIAPRPNAINEIERVFDAPFHAYDEGAFYRLAIEGLGQRPTRLLRDFQHVVDGFGLGAVGYWPGLMGRDVWLLAPGRLLFWLCVIPACLYGLVLALQRPFHLDDHAARALLWGVLGSMVLTLYLFLGDPRIRVPFDPLWIVLASDAWRGFFVRVRAPASAG
jgi:hypothetical protein